MEAPGRVEPRIHRHPRRSRGGRDEVRATPLEDLRRGCRIIDLERDADVAGDAATDLDLVDELGLAPIGDLERGSARLEDDDPTVWRRIGGSFRQTEDVAIEPDGGVKIVRCHDKPHLADGVHGVAWLGFALRHSRLLGRWTVIVPAITADSVRVPVRGVDQSLRDDCKSAPSSVVGRYGSAAHRAWTMQRHLPVTPVTPHPRRVVKRRPPQPPVATDLITLIRFEWTTRSGPQPVLFVERRRLH